MYQTPGVQAAAELIRSRSSLHPSVGVVLGSGLGAFADALVHGLRIPYREFPDFPVSTAVGHAGELVLGTLGLEGEKATDVAVLAGRFHLYEGYSAQQVAMGISLLRELGVKTVILTCAAGGLKPEFAQGALVLISDHINLQGANPLVGGDLAKSRFVDMTEAYPKRLRQTALHTAMELNVELHEGVYAALLGPSYETPAEIRFLKTIGADLVGMSTAMETIAANHLGMEVMGIACVTNLAAGLGEQKLVHEEVLQVANRVSDKFLRLLTALVHKLGKT